MYFPFLSDWQMINPGLNGIGFVTLCLCYIFKLEMRKGHQELCYLKTMRRLQAFFTASTPAPPCIQPTVEFFGGLKQVVCHNYYSSASSTEDKNVYSYTPLTLCVHDAVPPLAQGQLYLTHVTYPVDRQKRNDLDKVLFFLYLLPCFVML
jgi:hypothetical protein